MALVEVHVVERVERIYLVDVPDETGWVHMDEEERKAAAGEAIGNDPPTKFREVAADIEEVLSIKEV